MSDNEVGIPAAEGKDMKKRYISVIALGVAPALVLGACGGGDSNGSAEGTGNGGSDGEDAQEVGTEASGVLDAWAFDGADDVGQARLDYAEEALPDLDIQLNPTSFDAQPFTARMASGDIPDVVQMNRSYVGTYAAQGLIQPVDQCFAAHSLDPDEHWYSFVVDDVRWQDEIWAVPQFYQPLAVILNKDVMNEAGVANEEIVTSDLDVLLPAIEEMFEESGGNPTRLGLDVQPIELASMWALAMGGQLMDDEGAPTLDHDGNVSAIEHVKEIVEAQGGYSRYRSFTDSFDAFGEQNQFVADQVGAQVHSQWYPNVLSPYLDEVELNAVPFVDQNGDPFSVAAGTAFVIPTGAANSDGACAWMLELTSMEAWDAAAQARATTIEENDGINTGLFTGSPDADQNIRDTYVAESGNDAFDQVIATYYEVVEHGLSVGMSPVGQEINTELMNAFTSAMLEEKTPEQALADAQATVMRAYESATR